MSSITKQFADDSLAVATSFLAESLPTPRTEKCSAQFRIYSLYIQMKKRKISISKQVKSSKNEMGICCAY